MSIEAPEVFLKLSDYYGLDHIELAEALIWDFCFFPPASLLLIEHAEAERPEKLERFS